MLNKFSSWKSVLVLIFLAGISWFVFEWSFPPKLNLTQQPNQQTNTPKIDLNSTSNFGIQYTIPLSVIEKRLNKESETPLKGIKRKGLLKLKYEIKRLEDVKVVKLDNETVRIITRIDAKMRESRTGSKAQVRAEVNLDMSLRISDNGCPEPQIQTKQHWIKTPTLRVLGTRWSIRTLASRTLKKLESDFQKEIQELLNCEKLREQIKPHWASQVHQLNLPYEQATFLHLVPESLSVSNVNVKDDHLGITINLASKSWLAPAPSAPAAPPLPLIQRAPYQPGRLGLKIPIQVGYQQLTAAAQKAAVGKTFSQGDGSPRVTIKEVGFYPHGDRMAIRLGFLARGGGVPRIRGTVYATAKPVVKNDGSLLHLEDFQFEPALDKHIWNVLAFLFHNPIKKALVPNTRLDLVDQLTDLEREVMEKAANPKLIEGMSVDLRHPKLRLNAIYLGKEKMTVLVHFQAELAVHATKLQF